MVEKTKGDLGLDQGPYLAFHVRHGDKWTELGWFHPLERFVKCARSQFPDLFERSAPVFIMTDDPQVIEDTKEFQDVEFKWVTYDRKNNDVMMDIQNGALRGED